MHTTELWADGNWAAANQQCETDVPFSKQTNLADIWIADGNGLSDKSRSTSGMFKSQLNSENCSRDESSSILTTYVVWCNFLRQIIQTCKQKC